MKVIHRSSESAGPEAHRTAPPIAPGKLRWRCRRGMKELDVLLERFAEQVLPQATAAECRVFAELLELPDPLLAAYLLGGGTPTDPLLAQAIGRIRALCRLDDRSAVFCR